MKKEENRTLAEKAADKLIRLIREKNYIVGDKLPTETELTELLGVSRNTVREALRMLASRNMIIIRQGSGTFISEKNGVSDDPFGFDMVDDQRKLTEDLLQIRVMIEPPIAALAAQNATVDDIEKLYLKLVAVEQKMQENSGYWEEDSEFHVQIAKCTHNTIMTNLIPVISRGVNVFAKEIHRQEYQQTLVSHRKIYQAIADGKPMEAQQEMQFHILYNNNRYLSENSGEDVQ